VYVIRLDFKRMTADTVVALHAPAGPTIPVTIGVPLAAQPRQSTTLPAFAMVDLQVVTSDGLVAIVRWDDFHVDWHSPGGGIRSTPPVPWNWQVLSAADKQRTVDSLQRVYDAIETGGQRATGQFPITFSLTRVIVAPDLPDRIPAFGLEVRADRDGGFWVREGARTTLGASGPPVHAIIDRQGKLSARILLPDNARIAGFGRGGIVYLVTEGVAGGALLRARVPVHR
jgi:hypothetical protein